MINIGWKTYPGIILICLLNLFTVFGQRPPRPPGPPVGPPPGGLIGGAPEPPPPGQRHNPPPDGPPPPRGPIFDIISAEMRFDKVVKGAPYSAQAITESTQTLGDGTRISRKASALVYRDREGRTRREQTLNVIGPLASAEEPQQLIFINDPVAGGHYILDQRKRIARKLPPPPEQMLPPMRPPVDSQVKTDSLGKQTIEGVEAEGTRTTITIPAGQIGNDRPIEIVSERWYSPALQLVVQSRHSDPRVGENSYRLTNINLDEPSPALFEVPANYKITDEGPPPGGPRRDMRRPER